MNNKQQKGFFGPQVIHNKKIEQFRATNNKKEFNLHFRDHFVSCSHKGEFRGHFKFFPLNLLASSFYFWSNKLKQINHVIVNIFRGILIVTVNI